MQNFEFYSPTKIFFGKKTEEKIADYIKEFDGVRVLLHYGQGSAVKSGLIGVIKQNLRDNDMYFTELAGVIPNPRLSLVEEGIDLCKEHKIDFILAVGGGSVIDSAKAIAVGVEEEGELWDFFLRKRDVTKALPIGCVLTIASAGSEASNSCVIRNEDENVKRGILSDIIRPRFAVLNPVLTFGVTGYQLACGISDIIMHTLDRYFTDVKDTYLTDKISESILTTAMKFGRLSLEDPFNYEVRANLMWAGCLSHNTLTELGKPRDFSVHAMERGISGYYDTAHPAGLTILWPGWARHVYKQDLPRFCQYAVNVMHAEMNYENPIETAIEGIRRTEAYFRNIGMPTTFSDANIFPTSERIEEIANFATVGGTIGTFAKLYKEDVINIIKDVL